MKEIEKLKKEIQELKRIVKTNGLWLNEIDKEVKDIK